MPTGIRSVKGPPIRARPIYTILHRKKQKRKRTPSVRGTQSPIGRVLLGRALALPYPPSPPHGTYFGRQQKERYLVIREIPLYSRE